MVDSWLRKGPVLQVLQIGEPVAIDIVALPAIHVIAGIRLGDIRAAGAVARHAIEERSHRCDRTAGYRSIRCGVKDEEVAIRKVRIDHDVQHPIRERPG